MSDLKLGDRFYWLNTNDEVCESKINVLDMEIMKRRIKNITKLFFRSPMEAVYSRIEYYQSMLNSPNDLEEEKIIIFEKSLRELKEKYQVGDF